jgi:hypothetical protein
MALALALVAAGPPLVIHNGWPGLVVAVAGLLYAAWLLLGKRLPQRRPAERPNAMLSACARAFGRLVAGDGFERDRYVFRRHNEAGDALIIDFEPLGADRFAVRVGFLLAPYWEWEKHSYGYPPEKRPDMSHVNWVQQVDAEWVITDDPAAVASQVYERLPDLSLWLDRDLLWRAAAGTPTELGAISDQLKLWLLVERGQSEELRQLLDDDETDREIWDFAKRQAE